MKTSIAAGAALAADDTDVMKAIALASNVSGMMNRASGLLWQVGVRNEAGVIYRTVTFNTRTQTLRLARRMARIGYADELAGGTDGSGGAGEPVVSGGPFKGFDAIYSRVSAAQPPAPAPRRVSSHSAA